MKRPWSLKAKLIVVSLLVSVIPLTVATRISDHFSKQEILAQASERAKTVGDRKAVAIGSYFDQVLSSLGDMGASSLASQAIEDFAESFKAYETLNYGNKEAEVLEKFYAQSFAARYAEVNEGKTVNYREFLADLDVSAKLAQFDFLAANPNPLGEKQKMIEPDNSHEYAEIHKKYHEEFAAYVERHGLYDLFLVGTNGRLVYSVFKEVDFATDLSRGMFANSGIGRAFARSKLLKPGQQHLEDFAIYRPSYDAPASFAGMPLYKDGKYIGSLIVQMPLDKITQVAADRSGLGTNGQVLLLGQDMRLRADAFRQKETYNVAASFKEGSSLTVPLEVAKVALEGKTGVVETASYDGKEVLAAYAPIKILNVQWAVISELDTAEIFQGLYMMENVQLAVVIIAVLLIAGAAFYMGTSIGQTLQNIIQKLQQSTERVSESAELSEVSATQLSSAVTEQAASVQETMASAEQISAMINQNAESATKAKTTVEANQQSTMAGTTAVNDMVKAISEISVTNEKLLTQMENSNKEFSEIVSIISEIGEKTKVINDIVFQTKLLSFNASVEAARAGEHGKGFAVVAEEVGNLAQMSGNAAKEITSMLTDSIKRVNGIVEQTKSRVEDLIEVGRDKVAVGKSTASRCQDALDALTGNAATLSAMVSEIAHASKEQAQGVREINTAISQLDEVTQQNATVAQQSSTQAEGLSAETKNLDSVVSELSIFVRGGKTAPGKDPSPVSQQKSSAGPKKEKLAHAPKVVPIRSLSNKGTETGLKLRGADVKMASGDSMVPSADNPKFEDF